MFVVHFLKRPWTAFRRAFGRSRLLRAAIIILGLWVAGAAALRITEGRDNPEEFGSLPAAFWNISVYLLSGLDSAMPRTTAGRGIVTIMLFVLVEGVDPNNLDHLRRAGATEIVSAEDFSLKLLAQSALHPGLSIVYERLLTISAETNEVYLETAPTVVLGKNFEEANRLLQKTRESDNPVVLIGLVRDGEIFINPKPADFDTFRESDHMVLIAWEQPDLAKRLED